MQESNAEKNYFIFGYELDGKGGAKPIDRDLVKSFGGESWCHIDYSYPAVEEWLASIGIEQRIIEAMVRTDTRPRTILSERGVLILLRGINLNPGAEPDDMVSLRIWIEDKRVITVRQRRLMAAQEIKIELDEGVGPRDLQGLVIHIVEKMADRIASFVDEIEDHLDGFESEVAQNTNPRSRAEVSALRRQVASVRRYLAPQRDALEALYRNSANMLDKEHAFEIREQSDRITRYVEDLDLVRERILVVQEEIVNIIAQQQNSRTYVLSLVAAVFLPITFITGIFGMNVAGLPGVEDVKAFSMVAVSMLVITIGILISFRLKRWF
ncbi:MAG: zinc transporter ZntB [Pseudomonadales bacterium]|nr:zinc transporter ZntB [Gammaproteobacteria bacterium]NNL56806.1 zinc transporter ZntB [Pseudomonadales bacterium]